jgi:hypothetical protein
MSEDIQERLKDATDRCLKGHDAWASNKKDTTVRGELIEAIHDLRRATARLEIDIAINDRDLRGGAAIPIPSHRSTSKSRGPSRGKKDQGNSAPKGDNKNSKPKDSKKPTIKIEKKATGSSDS